MVLYGLPAVTAACGVLMVSRIPYPHILNQYLAGRKPFGHLIKVLVLLGILVATRPQITLVVAFCGFATYFPLKALYLRLMHRTAQACQEQGPVNPIPAQSLPCPGNPDR
jgi:phosphatidylserine synthase